MTQVLVVSYDQVVAWQVPGAIGAPQGAAGPHVSYALSGGPSGNDRMTFGASCGALFCGDGEPIAMADLYCIGAISDDMGLKAMVGQWWWTDAPHRSGLLAGLGIVKNLAGIVAAQTVHIFLAEIQLVWLFDAVDEADASALVFGLSYGLGF